MSRVRPPFDALCPECREPVEEAVVTDSRNGTCVVVWPCRHQFLLNPPWGSSFTPLTQETTP